MIPRRQAARSLLGRFVAHADYKLSKTYNPIRLDSQASGARNTQLEPELPIYLLLVSLEVSAKVQP